MFVIWCLVLGASARAADDLSTILGVTHSNGQYFLTHDEDFLNEGADQVLATGSKVIKVYLTPERYPWNSDWPKDVKTLAEMAQTPYFKTFFAKPFKTIVITAYTFGHGHHYFTAGPSAADLAEDTRQFHDLTKYLLTTYKGTGKTFVLQHWEGDWALRDIDHHTYDPKFTPTQTAIDGMIAWLNARQAGIVQARGEVPDSDVHVYGATEANRVVDSMNGRPGVANSVLPHTHVDLVSYSSWDSQNEAESLGKAVDYLASQLPPTAAFGQSTRSVYIGEFGGPENRLGGKGVEQRIANALAVTRSRHLPWAIFWEIYCNEPRTNPPTTLAPPFNGHNEAVKGHWMIKPDGTPGAAWHIYRKLLITSDPSRATASAIKQDLKSLGADAKQPLALGDFAELKMSGVDSRLDFLGSSRPIESAPQRPFTLGVRFDSADGHFATFSYYIDDTYAGSWFVQTAERSADITGPELEIYTRR